ncbi:MAG: AAA family ATPase [Candidatus Anstonellales archaeon]
MNLFERIKKEGGIFIDEGVLAPDYVPTDIFHREKEIREIGFCLRGIAEGKKGENAIVTGPPGTGKTTCAKHVLAHLREYTKRVVPVYINCWEFSSSYAVLGEIANKMGEILPRRGIAPDEIKDRILQCARRERVGVALVLDEVDRLIVAGEGGILYELARFGEDHGVNFSLVLIANSRSIFANLDERIRSSLSSRSIEFSPYSPQQLKEILGYRAKRAFFPGVLSDEVIPMCAGIGAKNGGDARIALSVLLGAGKEAEMEGNRKVEPRHVTKAKEKILMGISKRKIFSLNKELQRVFEAVENAGGQIETKELYKRLDAVDENEKRVVRKRLAKLEKLGFLESLMVRSGSEKKRIIKMRASST